ncbi:MAG TPA: LD-carboxypeptidase [Candidatus Binataceae bacterium]|nr:LD-carboxypeptidase [Candidatus Binataceae bacterium]
MSDKLKKPPALRPGDTVGVVAPSSVVERDYLERGVRVLNAMGYRVRISIHALDRDGILAGDDAVRASELRTFFADDGIRAIFDARGGYGCGRLLPLIDFAAIARAPKIFLGFSDATFMLNALVERAGIVAFHGPMVAMDFANGLSRRALDHLARVLSDGARGFELEARELLRPGDAEGELVGGCLSVVAAAIGTPYAPRFAGRVLFLEDTGEKAYRIDRMLVQLRQAGVFDQVAGIVFGAIRPVDGSEHERALIATFVAAQTADLKCPVLFGVEAGHGTENLTLPFGVRVRLAGARRRMVFTEPAVS